MSLKNEVLLQTERLKGTFKYSNAYSSSYCQAKDNIINKHLPARVGGTVASRRRARVVPFATPVIRNVQDNTPNEPFHLHYDTWRLALVIAVFNQFLMGKYSKQTKQKSLLTKHLFIV